MPTSSIVSQVVLGETELDAGFYANNPNKNKDVLKLSKSYFGFGSKPGYIKIFIKIKFQEDDGLPKSNLYKVI